MRQGNGEMGKRVMCKFTLKCENLPHSLNLVKNEIIQLTFLIYDDLKVSFSKVLIKDCKKLKVMQAKIFMVLLLTTLSVGLVGQPSDLIAKKQGLDGRVAHMNGMKGNANGLNLTDEQKEAFKQSAIATHKLMLPLRNELGEAEARQRTLETAEKPDFTAINKNIEKIGGIKVEMAKIQIKNRIEFRARLTDEQKMKFDSFNARKQMGKGPDGMRGERL